MAEPTLQEIFGAGATQDATTITILKADLPMTAAATNRGEQVLAAIAKKASTVLTPTAFNGNTNQSINIAPGYDSLVYRTVGGTQESLIQTQLTFNFAKVQSTTGITPDDY
jgi:hypothetical protein